MEKNVYAWVKERRDTLREKWLTLKATNTYLVNLKQFVATVRNQISLFSLDQISKLGRIGTILCSVFDGNDLEITLQGGTTQPVTA